MRIKPSLGVSMSSAAKTGAPMLSRYNWAKFKAALEHALSKDGPSTSLPSNDGQIMTSALDKFKEAYKRNFTQTLYLTGASMAPQLNRKATKDTSAVEKLIMRVIPRASAKHVSVGDVVAFKTPQTQDSYMVRRVAALEGSELVTENLEDETLVVPDGHCWVLADNDAMRAPEVEDSRTFGYIPMSSILGRIIYRISSKDDHSAVRNSPRSEILDQPIIDAECVNVAEM